MRSKTLLHTLLLVTLPLSIFANGTDNCKEIEKEFSNINLIDCKNNEEGLVTELGIENKAFTEEDINKLLSYSTIKKLDYSLFMNGSNNRTFSTSIGKLTNLNELKLRYNKYNKASFTYHFTGPLDNNVIPKNSKNLKKLTLQYIELSKTNIEEISTLTNLEELILDDCENLDVLTSEYVNKLSKLNTLSILYTYGRHHDPHGIPENILKNFTTIKNLILNGVVLTKSNIEEVSSLTNLEKLDIYGSSKTNFDSLINLKKLSELNIHFYDPDRYNDEVEVNTINYKISFKAPNSVNKLYLESFEITPENINEISSLQNLQELSILSHNKNIDFEPLKKLNKLTTLKFRSTDWDNKISESLYSLTQLKSLDISDNELPSISNNIGNLKNLEILLASGNELSSIPEIIGELKNLKNLDLSYNHINTEIPEFLNSLTKLEKINLRGNNISGKILSNKSLKECLYNNYEKLCKPVDNITCLSKDIEIKLCEGANSNTTTTSVTTNAAATTTTTKVSSTILTTTTITKKADVTTDTKKVSNTSTVTKKTDNITNTKKASTKKGDITTTKKASTTTTTITKKADVTTNTKKVSTTPTTIKASATNAKETTPVSKKVTITSTTTKNTTSTATTTTIKKEATSISTNGKCGKEYGSCPPGQCCSQYGWCGKTVEYCNEGCQSEFGQCTSTVKDKCGKGYGSCPSGQCCSQYGWCGKTAEYCNEGCQSEFGQCTSTATVVKGKCGDGYGKCPSGFCCSKYGWCGTSSDYCGVGCQKLYGVCN